MKIAVLFVKMFFLLFIANTLVSCEYFFNKKATNLDVVILNDTIDFSTIDSYPLLPECEEVTSITLQKDCFYRLLSKRIEIELAKKIISLPTIDTDTLKATIQVDDKGIISVKSIKIPNGIVDKNIKTVITQSIENIPKMQPAIKLGIPVTTTFILPIVLTKE